jgi:hypothetical protein
MFGFKGYSEILQECERESRLRSWCILSLCFTLKALRAGFDALCSEIHLNEFEFNE